MDRAAQFYDDTVAYIKAHPEYVDAAIDIGIDVAITVILPEVAVAKYCVKGITYVYKGSNFFQKVNTLHKVAGAACKGTARPKKVDTVRKTQGSQGSSSQATTQAPAPQPSPPREGAKASEISDVKTSTFNYGTTRHGVSRKIEMNVKTSDIVDALKNPLKVTDVKYDKAGRPSQKYIGKKAEVAVNPETKKMLKLMKKKGSIDDYKIK